MAIILQTATEMLRREDVTKRHYHPGIALGQAIHSIFWSYEATEVVSGESGPVYMSDWPYVIGQVQPKTPTKRNPHERNPIEAWMVAGVAVAGIAAAHELNTREAIDPELEKNLHLALALYAMGPRWAQNNTSPEEVSLLRANFGMFADAEPELTSVALT